MSWSALPSIITGLELTLKLFSLVLVLSLPLGLLVAVAKVYGPKFIQRLITLYIYAMRGTPLLLQLMFVFFGLPYVGITLDRFPAAVFAFVLNYAAYFAEIFRGGMVGVPTGQFEAMKVLGINHFKGYRNVIFPQVLKTTLPSLGNEILALVKDTSLVYILGLGEVLRAGQIAANRYASLIPFIFVGILYLIVTGIISYLLNKIEKQYQF
ncbi:MAG: amino acid ABC transporter permease [Alkalibacterium sp.]|uniref:Polar amino acid transport system permease protein n=1 Tax=Alkalibacterium gilvum TaxID=1130080 RepID=A0A1H6UHM0_9LACT|nr:MULTISPECIES: amino acid ABC transporter permease [Alkalibacterium]MDN6194040.1 amino acid ABC transporter permease [Alkalibacterium sp.]MDN6293215.1 amino acid ABC transporter permease [Alkalibacterium sp.]MDN6295261.1 amino acid ABC transporter permease [Alkalibacterium sp.]MDN6398121.1 amino acid ABC transporter permease [Alkalibacterium sp.]MDN6729850.1 amino acid ABC transporter permease [Alkalibacterium sp.]